MASAKLEPGHIRYISPGKQWKAWSEVWTGTEWIPLRGIRSATFKRETDQLDEVTLVAYCHYWREDE